VPDATSTVTCYKTAGVVAATFLPCTIVPRVNGTAVFASPSA
jgi:hypothetical protein